MPSLRFHRIRQPRSGTCQPLHAFMPSSSTENWPTTTCNHLHIAHIVYPGQRHVYTETSECFIFGKHLEQVVTFVRSPQYGSLCSLYVQLRSVGEHRARRDPIRSDCLSLKRNGLRSELTSRSTVFRTIRQRPWCSHEEDAFLHGQSTTHQRYQTMLTCWLDSILIESFA